MKTSAVFLFLCIMGLRGGLAAEAVSDAIGRAVRAARGIPGYPAAGEIR